ncbi:MAG TPA: ATP-binding cassette domain-containing protein [Candidatus Angelobacter sp.]
MNDSPAIEFAHVQYRTSGNRVLLFDLNLAVRRGEVLMLLGPSGSGKTTSLKLINGLLAASEGRVSVDGKPVAEWDLIRLRRHIGYAIQEGGLFPHYTVWENAALVPKLENWEPGKLRARVEEVLNMVGLPPAEFDTRYPHQLSGGQRQRVGLARALAADPPILLMDEPFGALDPITRAELQREFKELQQRLSKTVVFVTHDVSEALLLGHRIALMDQGTLRGVYGPREFLAAADSAVKPYIDAFRAMQQVFQT